MGLLTSSKEFSHSLMLYASILDQITKDTQQAFSEFEVTTRNVTNAHVPSYKTQRLTEFGDLIRDMEAGKLKLTKDPRDISINGKGFFRLLDDRGSSSFTRNIHFLPDKEGYLTSDHKYLSPKTKVPKLYGKYTVDEEGQLFGVNGGNGTKVKIMQLEVVNFAAPSKLHFNGSHYTPTPEAGKPQAINKLGRLQQARVIQGAQESSNVNFPYQVAKFKETNQQLAILARIFQSISSSQRQSIQNLSQLI